MSGKDSFLYGVQSSAGNDAGRLLAGWLAKAAAKLKMDNAFRREMKVGGGESELRHSKTPDPMRAAAKVIRDLHRDWEDKDTLPSSLLSVISDAAWSQMKCLDQTLKTDFGLSSGLAAPEVIVLDLYPPGIMPSVEAIRCLCADLVPKNVAVSADTVAHAIKTKFWVMADDGVVPSTHLDNMTLKHMLAKEAEFQKDTLRIFGQSPVPGTGNGTSARVHVARSREPVLAIVGIFPGARFLRRDGVIQTTSPIPESAPERIHSRYTRHDSAMRIFCFIEELLLASGRGVASVLAPAELCHIPEAAGMRKHWVRDFDRVLVDVLTDTAIYQLQKITQKGVCLRNGAETGVVLYKSHGGCSPEQRLVGSLPNPPKSVDAGYRPADPQPVNKYSFIPPTISEEYQSWMPVADIPALPPVNGLMEKRGGALIDIDGDRLAKRMLAYFNSDLDWLEYSRMGYGLTESHSNFRPQEARENLIAKSDVRFTLQSIQRYAFKPFDNRWCYYSPVNPLWNDPRPDLVQQCQQGNSFIVTRPGGVIEQEGVPFFLTHDLTDGDLLRGHAYCIPLCFYDGENTRPPRANLSHPMLAYLKRLAFPATSRAMEQAELIWMHVLAIGFSPAYLAANSAGVQLGWPRIPFPFPFPLPSDARRNVDIADARELLRYSAGLGSRVAALLDAGSEPAWKSRIHEYLNLYAELASLTCDTASKDDISRFDPDSIALTAKWGYEKVRRKGAEHDVVRNVMPGSGRLLRRNYHPAERRAIEDLGLSQDLHAGAVYAALGSDTCDIYLDNEVYWRNVPSNVWEYRIGGYPVLKKWLSYREHSILKRELRREEIHYFTELVQRLTALRLLESELDANFARIRDCGGDPSGMGEFEGSKGKF